LAGQDVPAARPGAKRLQLDAQLLGRGEAKMPNLCLQPGHLPPGCAGRQPGDADRFDDAIAGVRHAAGGPEQAAPAR
jgi:hypothetical protein